MLAQLAPLAPCAAGQVPFFERVTCYLCGAAVTTAPLQIGAAAVTLYAGVCVYEAWHDPRGPLARHLTLGGH